MRYNVDSVASVSSCCMALRGNDKIKDIAIMNFFLQHPLSCKRIDIISDTEFCYYNKEDSRSLDKNVLVYGDHAYRDFAEIRCVFPFSVGTLVCNCFAHFAVIPVRESDGPVLKCFPINVRCTSKLGLRSMHG